jgi:hypothetical protein
LEKTGRRRRKWAPKPASRGRGKGATRDKEGITMMTRKEGEKEVWKGRVTRAEGRGEEGGERKKREERVTRRG